MMHMHGQYGAILGKPRVCVDCQFVPECTLQTTAVLQHALRQAVYLHTCDLIAASRIRVWHALLCGVFTDP